MHEHRELFIYSEVVELWSSATCHHNRNPEQPGATPDQAQVHGVESADRDREDKEEMREITSGCCHKC